MLTLGFIKAREALLNRKGVTALEYALIASAVALAVLLAFKTLGTKIAGTVTGVSNNLTS